MEEIFSKIEYLPVAIKDLKKLSKSDRGRVLEAIGNKLSLSPEIFGKPLRGTLKSFWSLRVGDYRVLYLLKRKTVTVVGVLHRKEVYKEIQKRF